MLAQPVALTEIPIIWLPSSPRSFSARGLSSEMEFLRPFGPVIGRACFPGFLVERLNQYADALIRDHDRSRESDASGTLVPTQARVLRNVRREFRVSQEILASGASGSIAQHVANLVVEYLQHLEREKIKAPEQVKNFNFADCWIVSQFAGDFTPNHFHAGDVSGVLYLKVPDSIERDEEEEDAGYIEFLDGRKNKYTTVIAKFKPVRNDVFLFPAWLGHCVYPFRGPGERRSMSFNASITFNTE